MIQTILIYEAHVHVGSTAAAIVAARCPVATGGRLSGREHCRAKQG